MRGRKWNAPGFFRIAAQQNGQRDRPNWSRSETPKKRPTTRAQQTCHIGWGTPTWMSRLSRRFGANGLCGSRRGRSCNTLSTIQARPARIQALRTKGRSTEAAARKQSCVGSECGLLEKISSEPMGIVELRKPIVNKMKTRSTLWFAVRSSYRHTVQSRLVDRQTCLDERESKRRPPRQPVRSANRCEYVTCAWLR